MVQVINSSDSAFNSSDSSFNRSREKSMGILSLLFRGCDALTPAPRRGGASQSNANSETGVRQEVRQIVREGRDAHHRVTG